MADAVYVVRQMYGEFRDEEMLSSVNRRIAAHCAS